MLSSKTGEEEEVAKMLTFFFEQKSCSFFTPFPSRESAHSHSLSFGFLSLSLSRRAKQGLLCRGRHGVCAAHQGAPRGEPEKEEKVESKRPPPHSTLHFFFSFSICFLSPPLFHLNLSNSQVFVGGLSWATDDARLRQYFSNFGEVSEVRRKRKKERVFRRRERKASTAPSSSSSFIPSGDAAWSRLTPLNPLDILFRAFLCLQGKKS